jgi:hypothetical protein
VPNFNINELHPQFVPYFHTQTRVRINGEPLRTGRIANSSGWKPCFLLVRATTYTGSSDVLGKDDKVTHIQVNGKYVEVK